MAIDQSSSALVIIIVTAIGGVFTTGKPTKENKGKEEWQLPYNSRRALDKLFQFPHL